MTFPPYFYSLQFWKALSLLSAAVLAVLGYYGVIPPEYVFDAGTVLLGFLALLNFLGIYPELRAKGLK